MKEKANRAFLSPNSQNLSYKVFSSGISISFTDDFSSEIMCGIGYTTGTDLIFEFSVDFFYIVSPPTKFYLAYFYTNYYSDSEYTPQSSFSLFFTYGIDYYKE